MPLLTSKKKRLAVSAEKNDTFAIDYVEHLIVPAPVFDTPKPAKDTITIEEGLTLATPPAKTIVDTIPATDEPVVAKKPVVSATQDVVKDEHPAIKQPGRVERPPVVDAAYPDVEVGKVYPIQGFYFGFNKTSVYSGETRRLNDLYKLLSKHSHLKVQIQAYTDCRGNANVNKRVAMQRAASYKKYLEKKGIAANRVACKWFGTRDPEVICDPCGSCSEEEHKKNRRIEFKIVGM